MTDESAWIELDWDIVLGALTCAADNEVRYYLNGVYLDWGRGRIAATDGHILFVAEIPVVKMPAVIVPRKVLDICRRDNPTKIKFCRTGYQLTTDRFESELKLTYTPIEHYFPDYHKVVPKTVSGEVGHFNPVLLARCAKALGHGPEGYGAPYVLHNGTEGAAVVVSRAAPKRFCVVMPMRLEKEKKDWPWIDWFFEKPGDSDQAAEH